jgi:hypothetical protein
VDKHKQKLKQLNLNTREISDDFEIELLNEQYKMEFIADYDAYMKQKQCNKANTTKAYALIREQCAKSMQGKSKPTKILNPPSKVIPLNY